MSTNGTYVTVYERRVILVTEVLRAHSKLDEKAAKEIAAHVLYALDHIPETVR